jgi:aquaporin Z
LQQLWLFWVAPLVGAMLAGFVYRSLFEPQSEPAITGRAASAP